MKCKQNKSIIMKKLYSLFVLLIWFISATSQTDTLHYDGVNTDAIGTGSNVDFEVAAHYTAAMVTPYTGGTITQVNIYIRDLPATDIILKIYGSGSVPGTPVYTQTLPLVNIVANSWNCITLTTPQTLTASDIWVAYAFNSNGYTPGCDAGPNDPEGQWVYYSGSWTPLTLLSSTLTFNWNIRAIVMPGTNYPNDVGILSISSPITGYNLGSHDSVKVRVYNFGTASQTNIPVRYIFNGGSPVIDTLRGTIASRSSANFTFRRSVDLSNPATYSLQVCTNLSGDQNTPNDCRTTSVINRGQAYFIHNGSDSTCAGSFYDSGGPTGNYQNYEDYTYTLFPSTPGNMMRAAFTSFDLETCCDRLYVYDGPNSSSPQISGSPFAATSVPPGLTQVNALNPSGALTFRFTSDVSVTPSGWEATLSCYTPPANDLGIQSLIKPVSNYSLSAHDSVRVRVFNYGTATQTNIPIYYEFNGGAPVYDTVPGPITMANYVDFTFSRTVNLFTPGTYPLNVCIAMPTDVNGTNDCLNTSVTNQGIAFFISDITVDTCSGFFFDSGGETGSYNNDEHFVMTFRSSVPGNVVGFNFTQFSLSTGDTLFVYNGPDTTYAQSAGSPFTGYTIPATLADLTAQNSDGSLTFKFKSDNLYTGAGWRAVISCSTPPTSDMGMQAIISPLSSYNLTAHEQVKIRVFNYGSLTQSNIPVFYEFMGSTVYDTIPGPLVFGASANFTFDQPIDVSQLRSYYLNACIALPSDVNGTNDCVGDSVRNYGVAFNMSNTIIDTCTGFFFDSGGETGLYGNNENLTMTFRSSGPGDMINFRFSQFSLAAGDTLFAYNGPDAAHTPMIGSPFTGTTVPAGLANMTAMNTDGSITFVFKSDAAYTGAGWKAVINCFSPPVNDVGVQSIIKPVPGTYTLTATDTIKIRLYNYGTDARTNIPVVYTVNNGTPYIDTIPGPINFGEYADFSFSQTADMHTSGNYLIEVCSALGNDENNNNDCAQQNYTNYGPVYIMRNGSDTTCDGTFFDSGGPTGNYMNSEDYTLTFYPGTPGSMMRARFTSFATESGFEKFYVYDGTSPAAPQITGSPFTGSAILAALTQLTAQNAAGALTFRFTSDGSVVYAGWSATLSCYTPPDIDVSVVSIDVPANVTSQATIPKATVKNEGLLMQTFHVTMVINPGNYTSTQTVSNLASYATQQVSFTSWTPTVGNYSITVYTTLAGDTNQTNDTLRKTVTCTNAIWTIVANCPTPTYLGQGALYNGVLYSIGGNTNSSLGTEVTRYDVATNTWTTIASLPAKRVVGACAALSNGVYVIGGSDGTNNVANVYRYNYAANSWVLVTPLPASISWGKAVGYQDSLIYLAGGVLNNVEVNTIYVYNINTYSWRLATNLPDSVFGGGFTHVGDKLIYTCGTSLTTMSAKTYIGQISQTNRAQISWTNGASFPGIPVYKFDAAPWGINGFIMATGDQGGWSPISQCYTYNLVNNTWSLQPSRTYTALGSACGSTHTGATWKYVVATGYDGTAASMGTEVFSDIIPQSNKNHIITFTLPQQTGPAVIDSVNHTVTAQVTQGTSLATLTPTITVSPGATINPPSGQVRNFTAPVNYTVTSESGVQQIWQVTVDVDHTGIKDIDPSLTYNLYPNPASDELYIQYALDFKEKIDYTIYNVQGQPVIVSFLSQPLIVVRIASLSPGIYYIRFNDRKNIKILKFIKE